MRAFVGMVCGPFMMNVASDWLPPPSGWQFCCRLMTLLQSEPTQYSMRPLGLAA